MKNIKKSCLIFTVALLLCAFSGKCLAKGLGQQTPNEPINERLEEDLSDNNQSWGLGQGVQRLLKLVAPSLTFASFAYFFSNSGSSDTGLKSNLTLPGNTGFKDTLTLCSTPNHRSFSVESDGVHVGKSVIPSCFFPKDASFALDSIGGDIYGVYVYQNGKLIGRIPLFKSSDPYLKSLKLNQTLFHTPAGEGICAINTKCPMGNGLKSSVQKSYVNESDQFFISKE